MKYEFLVVFIVPFWVKCFLRKIDATVPCGRPSIFHPSDFILQPLVDICDSPTELEIDPKVPKRNNGDRHQICYISIYPKHIKQEI